MTCDRLCRLHDASTKHLRHAVRVALCMCAAYCIANCPIAVSAQQLLDRVVARIDNYAITLTDVQAALGLGIIQVPAGGDPIAPGTQQMVDRQLVLAEVQRFPPPEPAPAAVDREVARLKMNAGTRLPSLMQSTGLSETRIREMARDSLRILAYLDQRFGTTVQVSDDEVARYYREHEAEFARDGALLPFDEGEPIARQRASSERRRAIIDQWVRDLRLRANVALPNPFVPSPSVP